MKKAPWAYPYEFETDPALADLRHELAEETGDIDPIFERMETVYWQRCADHVAAWLEANATAPLEKRDCAFAYGVVARRLAKTAGGPRATTPDADELGLTYRETGNPLYAWKHIFEALYAGKSRNQQEVFGPVAIELPYWCAEFLRNLSYALITLGLPGNPPATGKNVLNTLALFSQGRSAYSRRARRWREQASADLVAELEAAGMTPRRARAVGFPHIADIRSLRRVSKRVAPRVPPTGEK